MMALSGSSSLDLSRPARHQWLQARCWLACGDSGGGHGSASERRHRHQRVQPRPPPADSGEPTTTGGGSAEAAPPAESGSDGAPCPAPPATTSTGPALPKLDVGVEDTTGGTTGEPVKGCRKVDFLFVIDNSGSMSDEQQNLINSFPGFIQTIQDELEEAQDYHIMVIDTDAYVFAGCELICPRSSTCARWRLGRLQCGVTSPRCARTCSAPAWSTPRAVDSSSKDCNSRPGLRYMDVSRAGPDRGVRVRRQGRHRLDRRPGEADAGDGQRDRPEGRGRRLQPRVPAQRRDPRRHLHHRRGRQRRRRLAGTVDGWKASLIAAKKGDERRWSCSACSATGQAEQRSARRSTPTTASGAEPSPRLRQFVESFGERGVAGSVCADSYKEFFSEAVDIIDSTCDGFVPPPQ
jgi:hypothetical protein